MTLSVLFVARASFADQYVVPSGSMLPTVHLRDHVLVTKAAYGLRVPLTDFYVARFQQPARGDVVVLDSPESGVVLLKRVVGLPGDMIAVQGGQLVINGASVPIEATPSGLSEKLAAHPHAVTLDDGGGPDLPPTRVPTDRFLVLGDNRGSSNDGRYFGFVAGAAILGRAESVVFRDGALTWEDL